MTKEDTPQKVSCFGCLTPYDYCCGAKETAITTSRKSIMALEDILHSQPDCIDEIECEDKFNEHFFAPGVYARKMYIPAGLCVVGKIHKHAHHNVILCGTIKVVTEFGEDLYEGPKMWVSEPGTKRAVIALTDTEWVTFHSNPSDTENLRSLESELMAPSFEALDALPKS